MEANYIGLVEQRDGFRYLRLGRPDGPLPVTKNVVTVLYGPLSDVHEQASQFARANGGKKLPVLSEREISDTVNRLRNISLTPEEADHELIHRLQQHPPELRPDSWYGIVSKSDSGQFTHHYRRDLDTHLSSVVHIFRGPLADIQQEAKAFIKEHPHARPMNKYDLQARLEQLRQHSL